MGKNHNTEDPGYKIIYTPVTERIASTLLSDLKEIPSLHIGDYHFYIEIGDLSPKIEEIARNELRETPEIKSEAIKKLRELLKTEEDLHVPIDNDDWLVRFLRPCKFYPESTFNLIKRYYRFKILHSDVYDGLKPSNEKNVFQQNIITFQQERDQLGRRILIIELGKKWHPNELSLDEFFKGIVLLLELGLLESETQVCGVVVIIDLDGFSLAQTTKFTPFFIKRLLDWLQDSIPLRVKNIHFVNQPYIFKIVYQLFKPFLREKLKKRLIFHGTNRESLHKYLSPECLPEIYGGSIEIPNLDGQFWLELLLHCDKEYEAINTYGYKKKKQRNSTSS